MCGTPVSLRFGNVEVRPASREVVLGGARAVIGGRAMDLLLALIERRDRVVPKSELFELVWPGLVVEENNLQVQISSLRKLFGPQVITTIPGRGYRFSAALDGETPPPPAPAVSALPEEAQGASAPSNLPAHLPTIFGRDADVRAVVDLLRHHHLVALVGSGGVGKTRLALAVAESQRESFTDGVWWVELASVSDPALVANVVAETLGIPFTEQKPAAQALLSALADQHVLIVLDNCEHVLDAASALSESLLRRCARVRVLVTSQESLKLPGEQAYRVPSLAVPAVGEPIAANEGAVALFIARAHEIDPRTSFDGKGLEAAVAICRALDGIPLAIELAAARVPLLGVEGLQQRLSERFKVLTAGSRRVLQRHQTLRAALEWSHGLLTNEEQAVFRRLGVFVGGFPLELAQAVASDERINTWLTLDLLGHLVDKSLVVADGGERPRYRLLETTRAFAIEQLAMAGETQSMLRRHAEALHQYLLPLRERHWSLSPAEMRRGHAEIDNLRAALDWAESSDGDRSLAYALLGASNFVWYYGDRQLEGSERCQRLLPVAGIPPEIEARFQLTTARLGSKAARPESFAAAGRAAELFRQLGNADELVDALCERAISGALRGAGDEVSRALEEADRAVRPDAPARLRASLACSHLGYHLMRDELEAAAAAALRQAACSGEDGGAMAAVHQSLSNLAYIESMLGRYDEAIGRLQEVLAEMRRLREPGDGYPMSNLSLAYGLRAAPGDLERALSYGHEAWKCLRQEERAIGVLFALAIALARSGVWERATLLLGWTERAWAEDGVVPVPFEARMRTEIHSTSVKSLGEDRTVELLAMGAKLSDERAASLAFGSE